MSNIFNPDFQDFLKALNNNNVDYVLVGGYAVILHGYSRTTGDMDIFVRKSKENYQKIVATFLEFGMPTFDMTETNFLENEKVDVFSFGISPVSIDVITSIKSLSFNEVIENATIHQIDEIPICVIHVNDLIRQKKAVNRPKDINDIEHLEGNG
ncbi:MAG: nucleotidyltransferase [Bacteroidota bacterium]